MVYRGLSNSSRDFSDYNIKKDADSAEVQQNSSTLNPNISETVLAVSFKIHICILL